jgi:hypothetical protein
MFWAIAIPVVVAVLALAAWFGRRRVVTVDQLERQRRQLGIHDGNGVSFGDR